MAGDSLPNQNAYETAPPSTLAAQLVHDFRSSSKSPRPDEISELRAFVPVIENVKNNPDLLKTAAERVEHNHMLIYVVRIVLEGEKWDNPFADWTHLHTEALRVLNCLRVTIEETPAVLTFAASAGSFVFRGEEPLWLWLFPKILRLLGHSKCLALAPAIENFFQAMLDTISSSGAQWAWGRSFNFYLRDIFDCISITFKDSPKTSTSRSLEIELPRPLLIASLGGGSSSSSSQSACGALSYKLRGVSQALHHASSLLTILIHQIETTARAPLAVPFVWESLPWILEAITSYQKIDEGVSLDKIKTSSVATRRLMAVLSSIDNMPDLEEGILSQASYRLMQSTSSLVGALVATSSSKDLTEPINTASLAFLTLARRTTSPHGHSIATIFDLQIRTQLEALGEDKPLQTASQDFWLSYNILKHCLKNPLDRQDPASLHFSQLLSPQARRLAMRLDMSYENPDMQPHSKRRKLIKPEVNKELYMSASFISNILGFKSTEEPPPLTEIRSLAMDKFPSLNDHQRSVLLCRVGILCCIMDGQPAKSCRLCLMQNGATPKRSDLNLKPELFGLIEDLIKMPCFTESRKPRVAAMLSVRRMVPHAETGQHVSMETSAIGQWCLKSLQSSVRELRIAAGRALLPFITVGPNLDQLIAQKNREITIRVLRQLSETMLPCYAETCIMAWGQVGRASVDNELNLVLSQLLCYLEDENSVISSLAFNEIQNISLHRGVTSTALFEPFWRNLAFSVVKDMATKPRKVELVAKMLHMSINEFMLYTQKHSLPWLFLSERVDVISKITAARGEENVSETFMDVQNYSPIMAMLLMQDAPDIERHVMRILCNTSANFASSDLGQLLTMDQANLTLELFLAVIDGDEHTKRQVRNALMFLAARLDSDSRELKRDSDLIGRYLRNQVLGLMNLVIRIVQDVYACPIQDRLRAVRAVEEMVKLCKSQVRIGRPHVATCLLSCFEDSDLRAAAFSCWEALIIYTEEEDVESLIETTFFIIIHYWEQFDDPTRDRARMLICFLLDQHHGLTKRMIRKLPRLNAISSLADLEARLDSMRQELDPRATFSIFSQRISHENSGVVLVALQELSRYLDKEQAFLQLSTMAQQPDEIVGVLLRSLLDCAAKYSVPPWGAINQLCAQCLGQIGCIDWNRVDAPRQEPEFVVVSNFVDDSETADFIAFMLENVLIKTFVSTNDARLQTFLSYVMQQLLRQSGFKGALDNPNLDGAATVVNRWNQLSEFTKEILSPFLNSAYVLTVVGQQNVTYPIFKACRRYHAWLRQFVADLLENHQTSHASLIFEPLQRVIRVHDVSVAEFLLPYVVLHVILAPEDERQLSKRVTQELRDILEYQMPADASFADMENMKLFYNAVFRVLDYSTRWMHKRNSLVNQKLPQPLASIIDEGGARLSRMMEQLDNIQISRRAMNCNDFFRALFSLELYIAKDQERHDAERQAKITEGATPAEYKVPRPVLDALLEVYSRIDDPDGLDGISTQFPSLDMNQQILNHRKAGRWAAAQSWYEIKLAEDPRDIDRQLDLLTCLKESGQYDILHNHVVGMHISVATHSRIAPLALEAFWATERWDSLEEFLKPIDQSRRYEEFNCGVAETLRRLRSADTAGVEEAVQCMREQISASMTLSKTSSLRACHTTLLQCHVLNELEMIAGVDRYSSLDRRDIVNSLNRRLEVLGAYFGEKQFVLGVQRAAMQIMQPRFSDRDIATLWLTSAKLARKSGAITQAFSSVLHASELGDGSSTLENARLLWKEGHNRKAIQELEGAIASNSLLVKDMPSESMNDSKAPGSLSRNFITAKAHLLLAKWLDATGQTHFAAQRSKYNMASKIYPTWEKGHYYLGRHYKKLLDAEMALKPDDQSDEYVTGQVTRLVVENYVRALGHGTKYLHQSLPRVLTLWLDLGASIGTSTEGRQFAAAVKTKRQQVLNALHSFLDRYIKAKLPAFVWYTAISQVVARIAHPNKEVFDKLEMIIIRVVQTYPQQALWSLFGLMTTKLHGDRRLRGNSVLQKLRADKTANPTGLDMRQFVRMGEKLGDQLLMICHHGDFPNNKTIKANIVRDLNFNFKCVPCPLVVPIETSLSATLPTMGDRPLRLHKPFSENVVTIQTFLNEVLVLGSLAKPRRVTALGSNGKKYQLLLKPSDDLRTDQRLMEFNGFVNRSLTRDAESSKRQLYVKTYAVTPLNEECGIIEWVGGLKTMRDILLGLYRSRGVQPNYVLIQNQMKQAMLEDDGAMWKNEIVSKFPPVLQHWFVAQFPSPSLWFDARLRYTRSCAVMSMVGTILGLGDRHGENVLLEEGNGGIFHVDFNCLFDKGHTFACPERVPFRLTHNMVHAMGIQGYEGAFRSSAELTLSVLRQQQETLMSILEAFVYDPTLDLQRDKRKKGGHKLNPHNVVAAIKRKIRGLMENETIPLGVEGQVEELIKEAVSAKNLSSMYIGWCPFL